MRVQGVKGILIEFFHVAVSAIAAGRLVKFIAAAPPTVINHVTVSWAACARYSTWGNDVGV
jgi:hypothetical protein